MCLLRAMGRCFLPVFDICSTDCVALPSVLVSGTEAKQYIISQRNDGGRGARARESGGGKWLSGARDSRQTCHKKSKLQQQIQWKGFRRRFEMTGGGRDAHSVPVLSSNIQGEAGPATGAKGVNAKQPLTTT